MQGMFFLIMNTKNDLANYGTIIQQITSEKYLCQFLITPASCRVVSVEELSLFHLFPNKEQQDTFLDHYHYGFREPGAGLLKKGQESVPRKKSKSELEKNLEKNP